MAQWLSIHTFIEDQSSVPITRPGASHHTGTPVPGDPMSSPGHILHKIKIKKKTRKGLSYLILTAEQHSQSRLCGAMKDHKAQRSLSPALWKQEWRRQCR